MNLTSLGFLEMLEKHTREALPALQAGGCEWNFQRFLAFHDNSGSLQVLVNETGGEPKSLGILQVRQVNDETGSVLRGWMQHQGTEPVPFVFHARDEAEFESSVARLAQSWASDLAQVAGTLGLVSTISPTSPDEPAQASSKSGDPASP